VYVRARVRACNLSQHLELGDHVLRLAGKHVNDVRVRAGAVGVGADERAGQILVHRRHGEILARAVGHGDGERLSKILRSQRPSIFPYIKVTI